MKPDGTFVSRNPVLKKVWADDTVIWDSESTSNTVTVRFYPGSETQSVDTLISAVEGTGSAPAYRGMMYIVIEDHDLSDFSNRIPNISAEIQTDAIDYGDIFEDVCHLCGIPSAYIDGSKGTTAITGLVQTNRTSGQDLINVISLAYAYDTVEADNTIQAIPRGGTVVATVDSSELGIRTEGSENVPKLTRVYTNEYSLPGRVDLTYYDAGKNYEQVSQGEMRHGADVYNSKSLTFPLTLTADEARQMAARILDIAWIEACKYSGVLGLKHLKVIPSDPLNVPDNGYLKRMRVTEMDLGDPGELRCSFVIDDESVLSQIVEGGSGGSGASGSLEPVPTVFTVWSGKELRDDDQYSAGFYVAANGASNWRGASIYYSPDSGTTWILAGTVTGRSTFGTMSSVLADGTTPRTWDTTHTARVNLSYGLLESTTQEDVLNGNNIAVVGNEILGIQTATLDGDMEYIIEDLYRGIRDSVMTGHASSERFILASTAIVRVNVPEDYVGDTLQVKCVSPYQVLDDVTAQNVVIAARTPTDTEAIEAVALYKVDTTPQSLASGTGDVSTWTSIDLSSYVPTTARRVILQIYGFCTYDGDTLLVEYRPDSGGPTTDVCKIGVIETGDDSSSYETEVDRPIKYSDRTMQYKVTTTNGNAQWAIKLIGYWRTI